MITPGPLSGVRVLDLADVAGAMCAKLLCDLGAETILVEPPEGSAMRKVEPFLKEAPDSDRSLFFWHHNAGKRGLRLDLSSAAGRDQLRHWIAGCDILVESFPAGHLAAQGLGYDALATTHPGLIQISITPFGQTGPYSQFHGSDLVCQAMGGMVAVNGDPAEAPMQGHGLPAYYAAGLQGAIAALLAIIDRRQSGRGRWIDLSIQAAVASCLEHVSSRFVAQGDISRRQGCLHWSRDFRIGPAADGYVVLSTLGDWDTLLEWLKSEQLAGELAQDPRWADIEFRRARCQEYFDVLDRWSCRYSADQLEKAAQLRRLPIAAVRSVMALALDPHLAARDHFIDVAHPHLSATIRCPRPPFRFAKTPCPPPRIPPLLDVQPASWQPRTSLAFSSRPLGEGHASAGQVLAGIRVIDLTWVVAGPLATRVLSDFGAEVIKIERIDTPARQTDPSGLAEHLHRGKRSLAVDLSKPEGIALLRRLIPFADVVIDNFSARVMSNFGLQYEALRRLRADVITVSMPGYGSSGPYRDFVSYGPTLQAFTGHTWLMRREPRSTPLGWGFSYSDMVAGYTAALATLAAVHHRHESGEGQHVEISQCEALLASLGPTLLAALNPSLRCETAEPFVDNALQEVPSAPHGVFRCADLVIGAERRDRWCAITVFSDAEWERLRRAMGDPAWSADERLRTHHGRQQARTAVHAGIEEWTRVRTPDEVMRTLQARGIAAGIVAEADDLLLRDPQLATREFRRGHRDANGYFSSIACVGFALSGTTTRVSTRAPRPGADTHSVLQQILGLSNAEIDTLKAHRIIA
jgi:crotonobetainyl-CoA:carnitine CoA-transferase CaiB-like acyl-CoA transferase